MRLGLNMNPRWPCASFFPCLKHNTCRCPDVSLLNHFSISSITMQIYQHMVQAEACQIFQILLYICWYGFCLFKAQDEKIESRKQKILATLIQDSNSKCVPVNVSFVLLMRLKRWETQSFSLLMTTAISSPNIARFWACNVCKHSSLRCHSNDCYHSYSCC